MRCDAAREAISAWLDDEDPGVPLELVNDHLRGCRGCREWKETAHAVTRGARVETAHIPTSDPALVADVVRTSTRLPRRPSRLTLARIALVLVAVGQLAIALPVLVFGRDHSAPMHVAHEMGSFDMALAIGFLAVAFRPDRARGMRPLVGAVALLLVVTAVFDLLGGRTGLGDEAPHLLTVVAWLLLAYIASEAPPATSEPHRIASVLQRHRVRSEWTARRVRLPHTVPSPMVQPGSAARSSSKRGRDVA